MEANELRLRNYVLFNKKTALVNPTIINYIYNGSKDYEPILLSEEWLLKLGFVKDYYRINDQSVPERFIEDDIWRLEDDIHLYCKSGVWYLMDEYDSLLSFKREMKGVHDLQNLFFSLKGKELVIKK